MIETFKVWMSKKRNASLVTFVAFFIVTILVATHLQWGNGQVMKEEEVPVYSSNRSDSAPLLPIKKGDIYYPIQEESDWVKVLSPHHQLGYMPNTAHLAEQAKRSQHIAIVNSQTANLRRQPDSKSYLITTAKKGQQFLVLEDNNEWVKIHYKKGIAFVNAHSVTVREGKLKKGANRPQLAMKDRKIKIIKDNEPIYAEHSTSSQVLDRMKKGASYPIIGVLEDFYEIAYNQNQVGFIEKSVAKPNFTLKDTVDIPKRLKDATIVLDPGHGGEDPGASSSYTKKHEKDFTIKVGKGLAKALRKKGAKVILTREDDTNLSLSDRAKLANDEFADAFISLHFDSSGKPNENSGISSYYYTKHDLAFCQVINHSLKKITIQNNGEQFGDFMVLRESDCPSILLEMGYMNTKKDVKRIQSKKYQQELIQRITEGLDHYFKDQGKVKSSKTKANKS